MRISLEYRERDTAEVFEAAVDRLHRPVRCTRVEIHQNLPPPFPQTATELSQLRPTGFASHDKESTRSPAIANARTSILDSLGVLDSKDIARILAPTSEATRSVAQKRRKAGELIGLPIGTRPNYRYPAFQFDVERHKIHDVVRHANLRLHVEKDPYGAASWWLTTTELLDGNSPLEDLEAGQLTEIAVDNVLDYSRRGMRAGAQVQRSTRTHGNRVSGDGTVARSPH